MPLCPLHQRLFDLIDQFLSPAVGSQVGLANQLEGFFEPPAGQCHFALFDPNQQHGDYSDATEPATSLPPYRDLRSEATLGLVN